MEKINDFDIFKRMAETDNKAFQLLPLGNIKRTELRKDHTEIVIGGPRELSFDFLNGRRFVGGLFLIDREEFLKIEKEMQSEQASQQGTATDKKTVIS